MVQVLVLGPIGATGDRGRAVRLGSPLMRRLMGVLATESGRPIARDRLIEVLWGDSAPRGATNSLQVYVSRLRTELGHDTIETSSLGYALAASVELDSAAFERRLRVARSTDLAEALVVYDEALALWRGNAFDAFAEEWWARPSASRLEELRVAAMIERIEVLLALGDANRAVADSELLLAADPLKESSVLMRMRALHQAGRSVDAIRVAAAFRRRLVDEAGLSGSPALEQLEQQILDHDPAAARPTLTRALRGYVFGELLAEGAHGAVYAAAQPSLGREVAVKVLRKDLADSPDFIRRFEAEAQFVARLEHPSIVPLYDYWREPGNAYLVMRLLRGGSLAERIARREPIPIGDVDVLIERIGDALHSAHGRGVVHRDVRAANVLYDDEGRPYLADFGIAIAADADDNATDDVAALAAMLQPLVGEQSMFAEQRSLLRRASIGEITTARELVMAWRSSRELVTPTPTPDRPRPRRAELANPYVGLRVFDEADAGAFFGRETAVAEIVALATRRPFVTVVGPSGAGKSSVVRAGVIPRLRDDGFVVTTMTPGTRPLYSLGVALRRVATEDQLVAAGDDAVLLLSEVATAQSIVIVVDQLEELWTQSVADDREHFVKVLDDAVATAKLRVITTIRADFYDRPLDEPLLAPLVQKGNYALTALSPAELEASISQPLVPTGVSAEAGLVAQIVADVSGRPAPLPLVQFVLSTLYDNRASATLTLDAYRAVGGVGGAIASAAEELFQQLTPIQQEHCRELFAALVTPGESSAQDTRRRAPRVELAHLDADLLDRLNRLRLLTFDSDPATGEPTVEIAHEALLTHWPRLREWTDDQREQLRTRTSMRNDAAAWEHESHSAGYLYRAGRLDNALGHLAGLRLTPVEQAFLEASVDQRDREASRERRRLHRAQALLAATAALLVLALVAGSIAFVQRHRADDQRDQAVTARGEADDQRDAAEDARGEADIARMTAQSRADAKSDPTRAMLLAVEAYKRKPGWKTAGAVQSVLVQQPQGVLAYLSGTGPFSSIEYGKSVIVARDGDGLAVWNAADYRRVRTIQDEGTTNGDPQASGGDVALSADDKLAAVAAVSGVFVYDIASGSRVTKLSSASVATSVAFDPSDRDRLAVGHADGAVEVVRWRSGQLDLRLSSHTAGVTRVSFSGSGAVLASSARDRNARVFDASTGTVRTTIQMPPAGNDFNARLSPSGNYVVGLNTFPDRVLVWRVADAGVQFAWVSPDPDFQYPKSVEIIDDATLVVTGFALGVRRFDLRTNIQVAVPFLSGNSLYNDSAASPDGKVVAIVANTGITMYSLEGRQLGSLMSFDLPAFPPNALGDTMSFTLDATNTRLLAHFGAPYLYDLAVAPPTFRRLDFPGGVPSRARFTLDGRLIETLHVGPAASTYQRWDPQTLEPVGTAVKLPGFAYDIETSLDGRYLAAGNILDYMASTPTSTVRVFDLRTGALVYSFDDLDRLRAPRLPTSAGLVTHIAFSDDSRYVAAIEIEALVIWDLTTGKPTPVDEAGDRFLDFDSNGRLLTVRTNGEILFRDITRGEVVHRMNGRSNAGNFPIINPDSARQLFKTDNACGGIDADFPALTQLWDLDGGVEIGVGFPFTCASWSPDGSRIVANFGDRAYLWSLDRESWVDSACRAAGRNLTELEWKNYVTDREPRRDTCP